jgi:predicted anti-sigma-YlaC factor YlaD
MKCEEVELKMIDYLDNNLDESSRHEIEKHLKTCENCLDALMDTQKVLNLMSGEKMVKPDESLRIVPVTELLPQ